MPTQCLVPSKKNKQKLWFYCSLLKATYFTYWRQYFGNRVTSTAVEYLQISKSARTSSSNGDLNWSFKGKADVLSTLSTEFGFQTPREWLTKLQVTLVYIQCAVSTQWSCLGVWGVQRHMLCCTWPTVSHICTLYGTRGTHCTVCIQCA